MIQIEIGTALWHLVNGRGILIEQRDKQLVIQFDNGVRKQLSTDALGYSLFTDKVEINYTDYTFLEEKYGESRELTKYRPLEKEEYCVSIAETGEMRTFVVLCKKQRRIKSKVAFLVLAIDVQSANIVRLVDTNGMERGLHTEQEWLKQINMLDVIFVSVKKTTKGNFHNSVRIVGDVQIIGQSDLKLLEKKYENFYEISGYPKHNFKMTFQDFFTLAHMCPGSEIVGMVYFSNTEIRPGAGGKLQLKMGQVFADIEKDEIGSKDFPLYYQGVAIMTAFVPLSEHRARVRVEKLVSKPSKIAQKKEQEFSLLALSGRFILGIEICQPRFFISELRTALCDIDGKLTEEQSNLYQEALFLCETPFKFWNLWQQRRFIDGMLFAALEEVCPHLDYTMWMNQIYQPVTGTPLMVEKLLDSLINCGLEGEFFKYCSFVVSSANCSVPEHRKDVYMEVIKEVKKFMSKAGDESRGEYALSKEQRYFDDDVNDSESDLFEQLDDSFFADAYEEYSEYVNEEEEKWDTD